MMKHIYRDGSTTPPKNIYRCVDWQPVKVKKAWRALSNTEYVKVWDIEEVSNDFIINLSQIDSSMSMSVTIYTDDFMIADYTYIQNGKIDWGDGTSTDITAQTTEYTHEYDISVAKASVKIKSISDIVDFYTNFCEFVNANASIVIPNSIVTINSAVFAGNNNPCFQDYLTEVSIPDSVTSIGYSAFENCYKLKELVLPSGVTAVAEYMCKNCFSLEKVSAKNVQYIAPNCFAYCYKLSTIVLDNVIAIANSVFYDCTSLASITLPATLQMLAPSSIYKNTYTINYSGTTAQWNAIIKSDDFWYRPDLGVTYTVHCTDGDIDYST